MAPFFGGGSSSGPAATAPPAIPLVSVGARSLQAATRAQGQYGNSRITIPVGAAGVKGLQVAFLNAYMHFGSSPYGLAATGNSITFKASVEANGTTYPLYFNGQRYVMLDSGGLVLSDFLPLPLAGPVTVYVRTFYNTGAGTNYAAVQAVAGSASALLPAGGDSWDTTSTDSSDATGTLATATDGASFGPLAVLGLPQSVTTAQPGVLLVGDHTMGNPATVDPLGSATAYGYARKALAGPAAPVGWIDLVDPCGVGTFTVPAHAAVATAGTLITTAYLDLKRIQLFKYGTSALCGFGTFDTYAGHSLTTTQGYLTALWAQLAAYGVKVYQLTALPFTTSTGCWLTTASQIPMGGAAVPATAEGYRQSLNAWLRNTGSTGAVAQSGGALTAVFDVAGFTGNNDANGTWPAATGLSGGGGTVSGTPTTTNIPLSISTLTPHALKNAGVVQFGGGHASSPQVMITDNTANSLTVTGLSTPPNAGDAFSISCPPTVNGYAPSHWLWAALAATLTGTPVVGTFGGW